MIHSPAFQFDNDIPWQDLGNGIQRQMFGYDDRVMLVKVKFEAGAVGAMHSHPHSQVTYVVSGVHEMTIDGEVKKVKAGDGFYVLPNVLHSSCCIEPGIFIDVFSPHREEFLK